MGRVFFRGDEVTTSQTSPRWSGTADRSIQATGFHQWRSRFPSVGRSSCSTITATRIHRIPCAALAE